MLRLPPGHLQDPDTCEFGEVDCKLRVLHKLVIFVLELFFVVDRLVVGWLLRTITITITRQTPIIRINLGLRHCLRPFLLSFPFLPYSFCLRKRRLLTCRRFSVNYLFSLSLSLMLHDHKSQSALEYLMTYGWAILIIVIVAAVLDAMGIFNPAAAANVPFTVTGTSGTVIAAGQGNATQIYLTIYDQTGYPVTIDYLSFESGGATYSAFGCAGFPPYQLVAGQSTICAIRSSPNGNFRSPLGGQVSITYLEDNGVPGQNFMTTSSIRMSLTTSKLDNNGENLSFPLMTTFTESGLPSGTSWNVTYDGVTNHSATNTITFLALADPFSYTIYNQLISSTAGYCYLKMYSVPVLSSGSANGGSSIPVTFTNSSGCTLAYVANYGANTTSVINTSTNTVIGGPITVGSHPDGVAITPNGKFAYVTNFYVNAVSVINTSSNTVIATITVSANPNGVAITPNGKFAYVTNQNANAVSVINTSSNTVIATITVGAYPEGIAITPNGKFVYVVDYNTNTVTVINTTSNMAIGPLIAVGNSPIDMSLSSVDSV